MKHYFRVYDAPKDSPKKRGIISALFSRMNVTGWIIFANVLFFFITLIAMLVFGTDKVTNLIALQPNNLFVNGYWWTLLTSMFMHAGFFHLFVNMFSLFFLGKFLEMLIGKKRFFWLYIISGIFAGLFFAAIAWFFGGSALGAKLFGSAETFAVGASGAIFAIAGVLALLTPRNRVYLISGPLIAIILQVVIESFGLSTALVSFIDIIITIYIFVAIFTMFSFNPRTRAIAVPIAMPFWFLPIAAIVPLFIIGFFVELPIGNMAHLGGFIAGAMYGIYLRLKYKRKTRVISEYFSK